MLVSAMSKTGVKGSPRRQLRREPQSAAEPVRQCRRRMWNRQGPICVGRSGRERQVCGRSREKAEVDRAYFNKTGNVGRRVTDTDDEGNMKQSPSIRPSPINHPEHKKFHWYDSIFTVRASDRLYLIGEEYYFLREGRLHVLNASKRGPHRPTQAMLEASAMHSPNLEFSLDPGQVLAHHHFSKRLNEFRASVILRAANLPFDYDNSGPRTFRLATIADQDNPHNPGVSVFGTQQEHDAYVEACYSAAETGWAVHLANGCEQN